MPRAKTTSTESEEPSSTATDFQREMARYVMILAGAVIFTALYAPKEYSERAFRVIDKFKRSPEPEADEDTPPARRRTHRK
ncbi:hypothetical protein [Streptomyces olivaceoviridis]|uniref:hypothetical protein n=1 Tax=Streptomyces olivaceoviridis TaxID=1921 RepID=UPI003676837C